MGVADYEEKVTDLAYDELIGLNSFSGLSYIATSLQGKWGLIEIRDDHTPACQKRVLAAPEYPDLDEMLSAFQIDKGMYR